MLQKGESRTGVTRLCQRKSAMRSYGGKREGEGRRIKRAGFGGREE
jgi:hypothetical protein